MAPRRRTTDQPESRRERRHVTLVAILSGAAVAVAFATAGFALWQSSNRTTQIQDERARNVRENCQQTNARHDNTIRQLRVIVSAITDPARRQRAEQSIAGTILLIDALAPKRDCRALVARQVASQ